VIARASLIQAARWNAGGAAALMASLLILDGAHAQQQPTQEQPTQQQRANPELKQFGPRANQAPRQQAPQRQAPKPEIVATHGAWAVQCQEQPAPAGAGAGVEAVERACGMMQTAKSERPGVGLTLVVVNEEQDGKAVTMLRVLAPIGVYLPTGVALEIDGDAVGRVPFTRCVPQTCMAIAEASPPTLEKMKKGGIANFIIYEAPGSGMAMELSLKGFTAALAELNKL
jgi:invasion protein IalB